MSNRYFSGFPTLQKIWAAIELILYVLSLFGGWWDRYLDP